LLLLGSSGEKSLIIFNKQVNFSLNLFIVSPISFSVFSADGHSPIIDRNIPYLVWYTTTPKTDYNAIDEKIES
jgi:hypothetical protein